MLDCSLVCRDNQHAAGFQELLLLDETRELPLVKGGILQDSIEQRLLSFMLKRSMKTIGKLGKLYPCISEARTYAAQEREELKITFHSMMSSL